MKLLHFILILTFISCSSFPRKTDNYSFDIVMMNEDQTEEVEDDLKEILIEEISQSYQDYKSKTSYAFHDNVFIDNILLIPRKVERYRVKNSNMEFSVAYSALKIETLFSNNKGYIPYSGSPLIPIVLFKIHNYDKSRSNKLRLRMKNYRVDLKELSTFSKDKWFALQLDTSMGKSEFYRNLQNEVFMDWHKRFLYFKMYQ